jgi:hypothetical protein
MGRFYLIPLNKLIGNYSLIFSLNFPEHLYFTTLHGVIIISYPVYSF